MISSRIWGKVLWVSWFCSFGLLFLSSQVGNQHLTGLFEVFLLNLFVLLLPKLPINVDPVPLNTPASFLPKGALLYLASFSNRIRTNDLHVDRALFLVPSELQWSYDGNSTGINPVCSYMCTVASCDEHAKHVTNN